MTLLPKTSSPTPLDDAVERAIARAASWRRDTETPQPSQLPRRAGDADSEQRDRQRNGTRGLVRWVMEGGAIPVDGSTGHARRLRAIALLSNWLASQQYLPDLEILNRAHELCDSIRYAADHEPAIQVHIRLLEARSLHEIDTTLGRVLLTEWFAGSGGLKKPERPQRLLVWQAALARLPGLVVADTKSISISQRDELKRALGDLPLHGTRGSVEVALQHLAAMDDSEVKQPMLWSQLREFLQRRLYPGSERLAATGSAERTMKPSRLSADLVSRSMREIEGALHTLKADLAQKRRIDFGFGVFTDDSKRLTSRLRFIREVLGNRTTDFALRIDGGAASKMRTHGATIADHRLLLLASGDPPLIPGAALELVVTLVGGTKLHLALPLPRSDKNPHQALVVRSNGKTSRQLLLPGWQTILPTILRHHD